MALERTDTLLPVEIPEGVELKLEPAGLVIRAKAFIIDFFIRMISLMVVLSILPFILGKFSEGFTLILFFVTYWVYGPAFEAFNDGQTPGKKICGIRAVQENGLPLTLKSAVTRNFLRDVDFLPAFYLFGIVSMLSTRHFQRLGDIVAHSLVVYVQVADELIDMPNIEPRYLELDLDDEQQTAIVNLAERHEMISRERQIEIANTLKPVLAVEGRAALVTLQAYANWLVGK